MAWPKPAQSPFVRLASEAITSNYWGFGPAAGAVVASGATVLALGPGPASGPTVSALAPDPTLGPTVSALAPGSTLEPTVFALAPGPTLGPTVFALAPGPTLGPTVFALAPGSTLGPTVFALALGRALGPTVLAWVPDPMLRPAVPALGPTFLALGRGLASGAILTLGPTVPIERAPPRWAKHMPVSKPNNMPQRITFFMYCPPLFRCLPAASQVRITGLGVPHMIEMLQAPENQGAMG